VKVMAVIPVAMRIASIGLKGAGNIGKAVFTGGKVPGGLAGQKALEYGFIVPALGAGATALGLPFGFSKPQAPAAAPPGGMSQQQMDFMYGSPGLSLPWQRNEGFMDRQLRKQQEMFTEGQKTLRMANQNNFLLGTTAIAANERLGTRGLDTQLKIADLSTSRQLEGLRDTNRTRVDLADRELYGLRDTNRSRIKMADIGARRDMYVADRSVEVARWSGAPARIATFGALMRG
jgi:hypothetical protein